MKKVTKSAIFVIFWTMSGKIYIVADANSEEVDASVGSTIGKKFVKKFVTKELPRIVYGKLPKAVIQKLH